MKCKRETILTLAIVFFLQLISSSTTTALNKDEKRTHSSAKNLKTDSAMLDINNIDCWFQNDGSIGEDPVSGASGLFFPRGQRTLSIIYTSGLWFFAKVNGEVRSAVNCYGTEFQPGIILPDGTADDPSLEKYRVYKYNRGDGIDQEAIDQGCPEEVLGDQMVFCVYNDLNSPGRSWKSEPMGIEVRQTAFGYERPEPMGNIIFIKFQIVNKGTD
ncbi:hypothetical protein KA005_18135, partial [bacterium]|nr:hypothetical protein [bacterium]